MSARRILLVVGGAVAGVAVLSAVAVAGLRLAHDDVLPGVTVGGVDVGGSSEAELRATVEGIAEARSADPVTFTLDGARFTLEPLAIGYGVDVEATVQLALAPGRDGGIVAASWDHVEAFWTSREVELTERYSESDLAEWVETVATEVDHDPFPGTLAVDPDTLVVTTQPPTEGLRVERDTAVAIVAQALTTEGPDQVELPVMRTPARITQAQVDALAALAERAVEAPVRLYRGDAEFVLQPGQIAQLLALTEVSDAGEWRVQLDVPVDAMDEVLADVGSRFDVATQDARFDIPRAPPVTFDDQSDTVWTPVPFEVPIVPSSSGLSFDTEVAATQLREVFTAGQRDVEVRLHETAAELTTEAAQALGIDTLLSTFTTYHPCCANRVVNIQRLADMVDGTVVLPGDQFSINRISGERTCNKGFLADGMILNGELVDVCGGGVSQFGTTTFNAAFFAGVPIDAYKAHSWYISRYPMGREATLNLPSPDIDVQWTNDTGHGALVRTSYTGTSITVSIYGHSDMTKVAVVHGAPYNARQGGTRYKENKALAPGTSRRVQSKANGFTVKVTRTIGRRNADDVVRVFTTVYSPKVEIIERNSDAAPPPSPEPSPQPSQPSPTPAPKPSPSPTASTASARRG